jgi:hypothetical protein
LQCQALVFFAGKVSCLGWCLRFCISCVHAG